MSPRLRKFIGLIAILAFCAFYVVVVSTLGDYQPHGLGRAALSADPLDEPGAAAQGLNLVLALLA